MEEDELFERIARLRDHLRCVDPIILAFCNTYGFQKVNPTSIGRYPRIRIERIDTVHRWFDLSMELTPDGKRYDAFFEEIPYGLGAGCFVDSQDGTSSYRYHKCYDCFSRLPFKEVPLILREHLEKNLEIINSWTVEFLQKEGDKVERR